MEHAERTRRECELVESRNRQSHQAEKDALVKEYEGIIQKVRDEYQCCNDTLRKASET